MGRIIIRLASKSPKILRKPLYRLLGYKCDIRRNVFFDNYKNVRLADSCFINYNVQFYCGSGKITIGENVRVAPNVHFCCLTHKIGDSERRAAEDVCFDIAVGDGAWICMDAKILSGVTVGKGAIVTAGSVVNKDIPDNEMWGGVPARFIKNLTDGEKK